MKHENLLEFIRYTAGNVTGMLGLSCYILADTFFISKGLGAAGLTALNLAIPVYSFVHGSGLMVGIGGAAKYSIYRGLRAEEDANSVFRCAVCQALILAAVFVLIGLLGAEDLTRILGADETVFDMTKVYLQMILLFAPAFILNDTFLAFVRNDSNPGLAMAAMLMGSFSNIMLDYIFIFPMGMGIFGAVLATGMAPIISMGVLSLHIWTKQRTLQLGWPKIDGRKWQKRAMDAQYFRMAASIFSLGLPSLIGEAASGIVMIVFNIIILNIQGNIGVAAYGIIANLSLVVTAVCTGVAQGMQPLVSREYGKNQKKQMRQLLYYGLGTVLGLSLLIYGIMFIFADPIVTAFNSEKNVVLQQNALIGLKLYFLAIPFMGCNIVLSMFFSSIEKALPAQAISFLRGLILLLPMAYGLSVLAGMTGIWLTVPVTEAAVCFLGIWAYRKVTVHSLSGNEL